MLQYSKLVLKKVSFNKELFHKELLKFVNWLNKKEDKIELRDWCLKNFSNEYKSIIFNAFSNVAA